MFKKTLVAAAVVGIVVFGGAAAAQADQYPSNLACTSEAAVISVGSSTTIRCIDLDEGAVTFSVSGPGVGGASPLASVAFAAVGSASVVKQTSGAGDAAVTFTAPAAGTFAVTATHENGAAGAVTITANAAGDAGSGSSDPLPATGGSVPAGVIWAGVGAIAVGGVVAGVAASRRRAQRH